MSAFSWKFAALFMRGSVLLFILCAFTLIIEGAVPTPEGLFRNGNNKNPTGNLVVASFMIEDDTNQEGEAFYFKLFIELKGKFVGSVLQVAYDKGPMKYKDIKSVLYMRNIEHSLLKESSVERKLFYSLLIMMTVNNPSVLLRVLDKIGVYYESNSKLINKRKMEIYTKYKNYLKIRKKDETLIAQDDSPISPEDEKDRAKIRKILDSPTYSRSNQISLVRKGNGFYWKVDMGEMIFFFTNENHYFSEMNYNNSMGTVTVQTGDMVLFNGRYKMPGEMIILALNGRHYRVRMLDLKHRRNRQKMFKRAEFFEKKRPKENKEEEKNTAPFHSLPFMF